jgi:hypothetical protein
MNAVEVYTLNAILMVNQNIYYSTVLRQAVSCLWGDKHTCLGNINLKNNYHRTEEIIHYYEICFKGMGDQESRVNFLGIVFIVVHYALDSCYF